MLISWVGWVLYLYLSHPPFVSYSGLERDGVVGLAATWPTFLEVTGHSQKVTLL